MKIHELKYELLSGVTMLLEETSRLQKMEGLEAQALALMTARRALLMKNDLDCLDCLDIGSEDDAEVSFLLTTYRVFLAEHHDYIRFLKEEMQKAGVGNHGKSN